MNLVYGEKRSVEAAVVFAGALLRGQMRNYRGVLVTLFTPLLLLFIFVATGDDEAAVMVPFIVGLTIMLSGSAMAQQLVMWRTQKIFQRLAVTPVGMGAYIAGGVLAQWVLFMGQSAVVLAAGVLTVGLSLSFLTVLAIMGVLAVSSVVFLSFGALIAAFVDKPDTANTVYIFILLPTVFLGGSLFEVPFIGNLGQYLPPTLVTNLLNLLFGFGEMGNWVVGLGMLVGYAVVFTAVAARWFKWE